MRKGYLAVNSATTVAAAWKQKSLPPQIIDQSCFSVSHLAEINPPLIVPADCRELSVPAVQNFCYIVKHPHTHRWGPPCRGSGADGLPGSCRFCFLGIQRGGDLGVPHFGPQTWLMEVLKSLGTPFKSVCSQGVLAVPVLASILRSWHWSSWNQKRLVYLWHLCCSWLFLVV